MLSPHCAVSYRVFEFSSRNNGLSICYKIDGYGETFPRSGFLKSARAQLPVPDMSRAEPPAAAATPKKHVTWNAPGLPEAGALAVFQDDLVRVHVRHLRELCVRLIHNLDMIGSSWGPMLREETPRARPSRQRSTSGAWNWCDRFFPPQSHNDSILFLNYWRLCAWLYLHQ